MGRKCSLIGLVGHQQFLVAGAVGHRDLNTETAGPRDALGCGGDFAAQAKAAASSSAADVLHLSGVVGQFEHPELARQTGGGIKRQPRLVKTNRHAFSAAWRIFSWA